MTLPRSISFLVMCFSLAACTGTAAIPGAFDTPGTQPNSYASPANSGNVALSLPVAAPHLLHSAGTFGKCLGSAGSMPLEQGPCLGGNPNMGWLLNADGSISPAASPREYLTVSGAGGSAAPTAGAAVDVEPCVAASASQLWTIAAAPGSYGAITTMHGDPPLCLISSPTAHANGPNVTVGDCHALVGGRWSVTFQVPDGPQLLVGQTGGSTSLCLDTRGGQIDGASHAQLTSCLASSVNQSLIFKEDATIRLQIDPAKCVAATSLDGNAAVKIATCDAADTRQQWTVTDPWGGWNAVHPLGSASLCLQGNGANEEIALAACNKTSGQQWMVNQATAGYLTCFFTGDGSPATYDQMYCTVATDGLKSDQSVNNGSSVLVNTVTSQSGESLFRDPALMRDQNGVYHVVATLTMDMGHSAFVIYDSTDLQTWSHGRAVPTNDPATQLWAPDMIYDTARHNYMVYYTRPPQSGWNGTCIYYMTTNDFETWSAPAPLYCDPNGAVMDQHIEFDGTTYTMVYRYNGDISMRTATDAHGPWGGYAEIIPQSYFSADSVFGEGPYTVARRDGPGYVLIWDFYGKYGAAVMSDSTAAMSNPNAWAIQTLDNGAGWVNGNIYTNSVFWNAPVRHGSMIPIT